MVNLEKRRAKENLKFQFFYIDVRLDCDHAGEHSFVYYGNMSLFDFFENKFYSSI